MRFFFKGACGLVALVTFFDFQIVTLGHEYFESFESSILLATAFP